MMKQIVNDYGFASWLIIHKDLPFKVNKKAILFNITNSDIEKFKKEFKETSFYSFEQMKRKIIREIRSGK